MAAIVNNTGLITCHSSYQSRSHLLFSSRKQFDYKFRSRLQLAPFSIRSVRNRSGAIQGSPITGMTFYDVLSVSESAELGQVKKAYREKVKCYHPDVCPSGETEESCKKFLLVQEAYETLCDPMLRADYDYNLNFNMSTSSHKRRNVSEGKQQWREQLQKLKRESRNGRETWGGRMRGNTEEAHAS